MGIGKTLVIIALIILAFAYFFPSQFDDVKANVLGKVKDTKASTNTQTNNNPVVNNVPQLIDDTTNQDETNTTDTTVNDTQTNDTTVTETQIAICDRTYSDYPDYYGTVFWGQDCTDGAVPDQECLEYPPTRYTGDINVNEGTSDPAINCCVTDGKCYWG